MAGKRNRHRCDFCKRSFDITPNDVKREWVRRGYDGDYQAYFIECPICHHKKMTTLFKLPWNIIWRFVKVKLGI